MPPERQKFAKAPSISKQTTPADTPVNYHQLIGTITEQVYCLGWFTVPDGESSEATTVHCPPHLFSGHTRFYNAQKSIRILKRKYVNIRYASTAAAHMWLRPAIDHADSLQCSAWSLRFLASTFSILAALPSRLLECLFTIYHVALEARY